LLDGHEKDQQRRSGKLNIFYRRIQKTAARQQISDEREYGRGRKQDDEGDIGYRKGSGLSADPQNWSGEQGERQNMAADIAVYPRFSGRQKAGRISIVGKIGRWHCLSSKLPAAWYIM